MKSRDEASLDKQSQFADRSKSKNLLKKCNGRDCREIECQNIIRLEDLFAQLTTSTSYKHYRCQGRVAISHLQTVCIKSICGTCVLPDIVVIARARSICLHCELCVGCVELGKGCLSEVVARPRRDWTPAYSGGLIIGGEEKSESLANWESRLGDYYIAQYL